MGIETPADLGGSEASFTSAIIAIEELAKVDPSVAVLADVHNTLVGSVLRIYGNDAIKEKWLPGLATEKVRQTGIPSHATHLTIRSGHFVFRSLVLGRMPLLCKPLPNWTRAETSTC